MESWDLWDVALKQGNLILILRFLNAKFCFKADCKWDARPDVFSIMEIFYGCSAEQEDKLTGMTLL